SGAGDGDGATQHAPRSSEALPEQDRTGLSDLPRCQQPFGQDSLRHVPSANYRREYHPEHRPGLGRDRLFPGRRQPGPEGAYDGRDELPQHLQTHLQKGLQRRGGYGARRQGQQDQRGRDGLHSSLRLVRQLRDRRPMRIMTRSILTFAIAVACLAPQGLSQHRGHAAPRPGRRHGKAPARSAPAIPPEIHDALDRISTDSLRGHLSFIASDLLEGRNTPSRGLEVAAEYIAAQFRRAGLERAGDAGSQSYFQTSEWSVGTALNNSVELAVDDGKQKIRARADQLAALGVSVEQKAASATGGSEKQVVKLRNVVGLLRGSDPVLKDSYVIVSAHYDHIGSRVAGEGDRIYNGANDDGSGTVSVIELASALATLKQRPKRSIVFIAWFGEEKGFQGSRYYGRHPIFPLEKTVAMVNLEHLGRTDDNEGPKPDSATLTGFDFTALGPIFRGAGEKTGVSVYKDEKNSDRFFSRSDNQALADSGIPAHTLCVAFIFPDYHAVGDHWEKIDYANLAKVNRMIALSLLTIADNAEAPRWNEDNTKTERDVNAGKRLHNTR